MSFSSSVESECSFGIRSAFSPYKPANTLYSQVPGIRSVFFHGFHWSIVFHTTTLQTPTPTILAHSQYSNIYRCQAWSAFEKAICYSVVQQNDRFGNADYNSVRFHEPQPTRIQISRRTHMHDVFSFEYYFLGKISIHRLNIMRIAS